MKKNLRSKILLCVLAGGVLAANTVLAAEYTEYTEAILGAEDTGNIYNSIKSNTGNNYTYTFTEDSLIKINGDKYGIAIGEDAISTVNTDSITIAGANLDIDIVNEQTGTNANGYGISIGTGQQNKIIDMSDNDGYINVKTVSDGTSSATSRGVIIHDFGNSEKNEIDIGNTDMDLSANSINGYATAAGIYISTGSNQNVTMGNGQIIGKVVSDKGFVEAWGVYDHGLKSNIQIGNVSIDILAESNTNDAYSIGIMTFDGDGFIEAEEGAISVTAKVNEAYGGVFANGIEANAGTVDKGAGDIIANAIGVENSWDVWAQGIYAYGGATVIKENGKIDVFAEGGECTTAYGVHADDSTVNLDGIVDINAEAVDSGNNDPSAYGIYAIGRNAEVNMLGGSITAQVYNNDGTINEDDNIGCAIFAERSSVVNVNQGTINKVVINGDIRTGNNAAVNLNLNTADSVLTGSIEDDDGTLNLENNASWIATGYSEVNKLTMKQGNIYIETPINNDDITINEYSGVGNIIFKADNTDEDGIVNINTSSFIISDALEDSFINVGVSNAAINTLDFNKAEENLNTLAGKVYYDGDKNNLNGKVIIKEGLITPEVSGDLLFDSNRNRGYVANVKQNSSTTTIDNIKNIAATAIVAWRQEDSTLSQRLGELRESDGGQGIWVRMSRGEFEYDGKYKNQYNFFQMGYDWAAGNWHYGAAVSHNDGQTTYTHGDGENRSTSLSLYGTWLGDKGHYADIVLKQGRLSNDFDIYTEAGHTSGDYDAWGTSLSGEYGMKVDLDGGWYVTPQAQLTLMRIGGEDYTTNNGIKVNQDSLESAVGRVGFEVGKRISDSGSIYAKASLLHDFAGSADTYLSHKGLTNSYHQDIGDTWCEAGIGFNYKTSENSYVYADVVKTFGGDVETPWQWNAGMRWTF